MLVLSNPPAMLHGQLDEPLALGQVDGGLRAVGVGLEDLLAAPGVHHHAQPRTVRPNSFTTIKQSDETER